MNKATVRNAIIIGVTAFSAVGGAVLLARSSMSTDVMQAAEGPAKMMTEAVERVAAATSGESYVGFDTNNYPGDRAMDAWRRTGQYQWVGYYLPAPCHKDGSWSGKRQHLVESGWGLAVIYVGQQTWGHSLTAAPKPKAVSSKKSKSSRRPSTRGMSRKSTVPVAKPGETCSASFATAARGTVDANDAIARTEREGFAKGTVIFLDVERMETIPPVMRDYYRAWATTVLADGRYRPGVYTHTHNAQAIYSDIREVFDGAGVKSEPPFWIAGSSDFDTEKSPTDVGHSFAAVWQGLLDVVRTHNGVKLPVDISVSAVPSPSAAVE